MRLYASGRYREAAESFRGAVRLKHDSAEAYNDLEVALTGLGLSDEASAALARAVGLRPGYVEAHYSWQK